MIKKNLPQKLTGKKQQITKSHPTLLITSSLIVRVSVDHSDPSISHAL